MFSKLNWCVGTNKLTLIYNPFIDIKFIFLNNKFIFKSFNSNSDDVMLNIDSIQYILKFHEYDNIILLNKQEEKIPYETKNKIPFYFYLLLIIDLILPLITFESPIHWYSALIIILMQKLLLSCKKPSSILKFILCIILSISLYIVFLKEIIFLST